MCLTCDVVRRLAELNARHALILAALDGRIESVECAMPTCRCPDGRGYFTQTQFPWGVSADRWPITGKDGGGYLADNVRVAHYLCNSAEGFERGHATMNGSSIHRERKAAFMRRRNADPVYSAKRIAGLKGRPASPGSFQRGHPYYPRRSGSEGGRFQSV